MLYFYNICDFFMLILSMSNFIVNSEWVEISQSAKQVLKSWSTSTAPTTLVYENIMRPPIQQTTTTSSMAEKRLFVIENNTKIPDFVEDEKMNPKEEPENEKIQFLPFLESVQQNLINGSKLSLNGKINLLANLRDHLLCNIDDKIKNLWVPQKSSRQARGYDDHDMGFPSNEGALMTIGFLTFAVFLIKLVLKLIHALKHKKHHNGSVMVVTTYNGRKKRDITNDYKILQMIEEFKN